MIIEVLVKELKNVLGSVPAARKLITATTIPVEHAKPADENDKFGDMVQKASWLALPFHIYLLFQVNEGPTSYAGAAFCSLLAVTGLVLTGAAAEWLWDKLGRAKPLPDAWSAIFFENWAFAIVWSALSYLLFHRALGLGGVSEGSGDTFDAFLWPDLSGWQGLLNSLFFVALGFLTFIVINFRRPNFRARAADVALVFAVSFVAYYTSVFWVGRLTL